MKRAVSVGDHIDFVCGSHRYFKGEIAEIDHVNSTLAVKLGVNQMFYIDFTEVRRVHDRVAA